MRMRCVAHHADYANWMRVVSGNHALAANMAVAQVRGRSVTPDMQLWLPQTELLTPPELALVQFAAPSRPATNWQRAVVCRYERDRQFGLLVCDDRSTFVIVTGSMLLKLGVSELRVGQHLRIRWQASPNGDMQTEIAPWPFSD